MGRRHASRCLLADAASIDYSKSHGCIHMRVPDAEWLFERVRLGTPVIVVLG
jgi:lipoprotein-anchoring transpeptidase ErfK/SrfK